MEASFSVRRRGDVNNTVRGGQHLSGEISRIKWMTCKKRAR